MTPCGHRFWRRGYAAALCVLTAASLSASARPALAGPVGTLTAPVGRAAPRAGAPVAALAAGTEGFGYRLNRVSAAPGGNWVTSPASIAEAFAMARAGAGGATAAQLDRAFGFPGTGTGAAFNALTQRIAPGGSGPVSVANALFCQAGTPIGARFLGSLAADHGAGVHTVDFRSPAAAEGVNQWVRTQTHGRIDKLFDRLDPGTRLVLADTVYLKADWRYPFEPGGTYPRPFTRLDGQTANAATMGLTQDLGYASGPGWQAVELPYRDSDLAMLVLVPTGRTDPGRLLDPATLTAARAGLRSTLVSLALPRFDFGTDLDLTGPLTQLGVTDAFGPGADFAGISPGMFIGQAVHRANITVDEKGTTAAAATGIAMPMSGWAGTPVEVRADHPFAFAVVDRPTGLPLFAGQVADPAAG